MEPEAERKLEGIVAETVFESQEEAVLAVGVPVPAEGEIEGVMERAVGVRVEDLEHEYAQVREAGRVDGDATVHLEPADGVHPVARALVPPAPVAFAFRTRK